MDDDVLDEADDLEDVPDLEVPNILLSLEEARSDARLRAYWTRGKGAAKIRWGVKGDFNRCVRHLRKYVADPKGLCAEYHHDALGVWPGREHKKESAGTGEVEEIDVSNRVKTRTPGRYEPQPILDDDEFGDGDAVVAEAETVLAEADVSNTPWSQFSQADYTPEQWARACLVDRGEDAGEGKQRYALPVREPDGTLNRNAVHAAAGGHGIAAVKGISDEQRRAVARKLVSLYRNQLEEEPPESLLSLAGMSESDGNLILDYLTEHLPGRHNQKTHGHRFNIPGDPSSGLRRTSGGGDGRRRNGGGGGRSRSGGQRRDYSRAGSPQEEALQRIEDRGGAVTPTEEGRQREIRRVIRDAKLPSTSDRISLRNKGEEGRRAAAAADAVEDAAGEVGRLRTRLDNLTRQADAARQVLDEDGDELSPRVRALIQSALDRAPAATERARADLEAAERRLEDASADWERAREAVDAADRAAEQARDARQQAIAANYPGRDAAGGLAPDTYNAMGLIADAIADQADGRRRTVTADDLGLSRSVVSRLQRGGYITRDGAFGPIQLTDKGHELLARLRNDQRDAQIVQEIEQARGEIERLRAEARQLSQTRGDSLAARRAAAAQQLANQLEARITQLQRERVRNHRGTIKAVPTTESAQPTVMTLREAVPTAVLATPDGPTGATQLLQLIDAGWGASGYYPEQVLRQAAHDKVFHEGLQLFIDHPTSAEEADRPERSVRDLAAVLTEDARYDPQRRALVATAQVFPDHRDTLVAKHRHIGLSIRANGQAEYGEAEGRRGPIVKAITEAFSVDFVTRAGRGGKVLALLEAGRGTDLREAASLGSYFEAKLHTAWTLMADEAYAEGRLTRQERIALSSAVGDALDAYVARVQVEAPGVYERGLYEEAPEQPADAGIEDVTDGTLPAAPTNSPEEEPEMSGTNTGASPGTAGTATVAETAQNTLSAEARAQIAESKLAEAQAQITALQAQNASLTVERDTARGEVRRLRATEAARNACAAALQESDLPAPAQRRITESVAANVPLTESGEVDTNALTAAITEQVEAERAYIASIREAAGEGTPTGLGGSIPVAPVDQSEYRTQLATRMQRLGLSEAAAKAAAGR